MSVKPPRARDRRPAAAHPAEEAKLAGALASTFLRAAARDYADDDSKQNAAALEKRALWYAEALGWVKP